MGKELFICEQHNQVLESWFQFQKSVNQPVDLVTLDYHLDTAIPFRKEFSGELSSSEVEALSSDELKQYDLNCSGSRTQLITRLKNDEHIIAAANLEILQRIFIINHGIANMSDRLWDQYKMMIAQIPMIEVAPGKQVAEVDQILETDFLEETLSRFQSKLLERDEKPIFSVPFILDIDLDYFRTLKATQPENPEFFLKLIRQAGLITIALEPDYVDNLKMDSTIDSQSLLDEIMKSIKTACPQVRTHLWDSA